MLKTKLSKKQPFHTGKRLGSKNSFDIVDCRGCGFVHILPLPSADELNRVYREEYYQTEKPLYLERYTEDLEWWETVFEERYDELERLLGRERRTLLEVGSGPGYFLLHGKKRGWKVSGLEPSRQAAAHSRTLGLPVKESFLNPETAKTLGRFDAIYMNEVLEHIPDPRLLLKLCRELLKPGGILTVVVPNDFNPFQEALEKALRFDRWWLAPPHHINYFTFQSLSQLFKKSGFTIAEKGSSFPIDIFLLMGCNYVGNDALGRQCHAMRKQFELNLKKAGQTALKRSLYRALAEHGVGREIVLYGRRETKRGV